MLEKNDIEFEYRDYRKDPLTESEIRSVLADADTKKHVANLGGDIRPSTPDEMRRRGRPPRVSPPQ